MVPATAVAAPTLSAVPATMAGARAGRDRCRGCAAAPRPASARRARGPAVSSRPMPGQDQRRRSHTCVQAAVGQRAHQPEDHLDRGERIVRQVERERDQRRRRGSRRRRRRGSASAARRARRRAPSPPSWRRPPPSEAADRQRQREGRRQARMDGEHRAERRAAGDAEQARLGQRVAQVALQRRARQPSAPPTRAPRIARGRRISAKISRPASPVTASRSRPGRPSDSGTAGGPSGRRTGRRPLRPRAHPCECLRGPRAAVACGVVAAACSRAPRSARGVAPAIRPHRRCAASRTASGGRAVRVRPARTQDANGRMAQVVGQHGAVLVRRARPAPADRAAGHERLQRHLAAATQAIVARHVAEAGGGERGIGEASPGPRPSRRPGR